VGILKTTIFGIEQIRNCLGTKSSLQAHPMLANGEQKIFIWIDFSSETGTTIAHGVQVASILDKEICLMHQRPNEAKNIEEAKSRLVALALPLVAKFGLSRIHTYVTAQPLEIILTELAEEFDALLLVAPKRKSKVLLPKLSHSGFPFLFVSAILDPERSYQKIAVPVGYMKKSKDLALWSSYLARHNGAKVSLIKAIESSEEDRKRVMGNLFSIERLFRNFPFAFETIEMHSPSWKIQKKALEHALGFKNGLLIISFTHGASFIDRLFGLNDGFVIEHSEELSLMCINSQRDLYTLCG